MQQMTSVSILAIFQTTKEQRESFASDLLARIENGEVNPLNIHIQFKAIEDIKDRLTDTKKYPESAGRYRNSLLEAAAPYGKKFEYMGAKIEQKEVGVKYDYSQCEDPVLARLEAEADAAAKALKQRQDMLKTIPLSGMTMVDDTTGETFTAYPPSKSSTSYIAVSV